MNLYDGLPQGFAVGALAVEIEHGALFWMRLSEKLEAADETKAYYLLEGAIKSIKVGVEEIPPHALSRQQAQSVFERLIWFMRGGKDAESNAAKSPATGEKLLSYAKDIDAIYAAFLQVYGLDLFVENDGQHLIETLHWWKFLALMHNLPEGNRFTDYYLHYRSIDLSKLPAKTEADRKYKQSITEIKQAVSLGRREPALSSATWGPALRVKELKTKGEAV